MIASLDLHLLEVEWAAESSKKTDDLFENPLWYANNGLAVAIEWKVEKRKRCRVFQACSLIRNVTMVQNHGMVRCLKVAASSNACLFRFSFVLNPIRKSKCIKSIDVKCRYALFVALFDL